MAASKKVLLATSVASVLMSSVTFAAPSEAPPAFVKRISDQLIAQLKQNKAQLNNPTVVNRIVAQNIEPHVDTQTFTRLVMGQYYSNQHTTAAQRGQFSKNFRDSIIRTYAKGLAKYSNEGYSIRPYKNTNSSTPVVMIDYRSANGSKIPMAFQLNSVNDQWKIRNINVNGIDLAATFRDQFKSTVQSNGGDVAKAINSFKPNADAVEKKIK